MLEEIKPPIDDEDFTETEETPEPDEFDGLPEKKIVDDDEVTKEDSL